ncbi:MAG: MBL fold metallo-hydrolase, partial [Verrucomicrobiota bacterium]
FITHTHNDHIADIDRLRGVVADPDNIYSNRAEPLANTTKFREGATLSIGNLTVKTFTTSGHSVGGTTFFIQGLATPIAVVGDAIFAGSMGGGFVSFTDALKHNRRKILTFPEETILCPGHGPMSTVGEEQQNNPFYAKHFK